MVNIAHFKDGTTGMACRLAACNVDLERSAVPRHQQDKLRPPKCGPQGINFVAKVSA